MIKTYQDDPLTAKCLSAIANKLGWGDSSNWSNADFEELSSLIEVETGVKLSVTTLKRVWGKVKYENKPTVTTLNTLARFSGFESWRAFALQENQRAACEDSPAILNAGVGVTATPAVETRSGIPGQLPKTKSSSFAVVLVLIITGLGFITLFSFYHFTTVPEKQTLTDASTFAFSLNKVVTNGVPNSVIFNYDATAAISDSVYIVQTWDIRRKTLVPKTKKEFSTIYYYPGYFRTKLIADSQVVKERDLMITTDGWLALMEQNPVPVYFSKNEYLKNGVAEVTAGAIESHHMSMEPRAPNLRFFNLQDMGDLKNDNFTFETTLKADFNKGSAACQYVQVLIQCKDDIIIIPLCAKACVGNLALYFAGKEVTSQDADLSKFGCDLSGWMKLRVESRDRHVKIYVNNEEACSLIFDHDATGIVGLQYRFEGTGAVKDTRFTRGGKVFGDFGF